MKDHWGHEIVTCPGCGVRVVPGNRYCSECGTRLKMCEDCKRAFRHDGARLCLVNGVTVKGTDPACGYWEEDYGDKARQD